MVTLLGALMVDSRRVAPFERPTAGDCSYEDREQVRREQHVDPLIALSVRFWFTISHGRSCKDSDDQMGCAAILCNRF